MDFTMNLTNILKNIDSEEDKIYLNTYYTRLNKYIEVETTLININNELIDLIKDKYDIVLKQPTVDKKQEKILYTSFNELANSIIKLHEDILNNKINFINLIKLYKKK